MHEDTPNEILEKKNVHANDSNAKSHLKPQMSVQLPRKENMMVQIKVAQ